MDIEKILLTGDKVQLLNLLNLYNERQTWMEVRRRSESTSSSAAAVAEATLAELPVVTALEALQANKQLAKLLWGSQWMAMLDAREQGADWDEIAATLGLRGKAGEIARGMYLHQIELQEQHSPSHDAARARAVVEDPAPGVVS